MPKITSCSYYIKYYQKKNEFLPIVKNILFHASLKYSKCMLRKQKSHIHKRKKKIKFRIKFEDSGEFHELIFTKVYFEMENQTKHESVKPHLVHNWM